jgi:hypothetical protein
MGRAMVGLLKNTKSAKESKAPAKKETALTRGRAPATKNQAANEGQPDAASQPAVDPSAAKADRLLKTAQTAEEMGQRDAAKAFYNSLVAQYPNTPAAKKAAERLKGL